MGLRPTSDIQRGLNFWRKGFARCKQGNGFEKREFEGMLGNEWMLSKRYGM